MKHLIKKLLRESLDNEIYGDPLSYLKEMTDIDGSIYSGYIFFHHPTKSDRPLSSFDNMKSELNTLPLKNLIPTQKTMSSSNIRRYFNNDFDTSIIVFKINNNFYIRDGHHRAASLILKKINDIAVNLVDIDSLYQLKLIDDKQYNEFKRIIS